MKELKFSHITKTAGTSIENIANENGIMWGRFDRSLFPFNQYHCPIKDINFDIKNQYDWFIIVRNPYTRIISELYCKWGNNKEIRRYNLDEIRNLNNNQINSYIRENILSIELKISNHKKYGYLEQYKYLDDSVNMHVLKYENLKSDFENLMKDYGYNLELNTHVNIGNKGEYKKFSIQDMDKDTITLINKVYKKDFDIFGYEMINI